MKGTIKRFYFKKGFGFIENGDGEELFFHYSDFDGPKRLLRSDTEVTFNEAEGDKGLYAENIQIEGYDPSADPDYERDAPEGSKKPAKSKPTSNAGSGGGSLITGLIIGLIIGAAAGYYIALNMPIGG